MEMNEMTSPLFMLRVVENCDSGIYYSIAVEGGDQSELPQSLFFNSLDYSITFIEPYAPFHQYLLDNEKWLRSILYTTLKNSNREKVSIPFSFPDDKPLPAPPENAVTVYCDGSCGDTGNGGWGGVIIFPGADPVEITGEENSTTSNRMELAAAVESLLKAEEMMRSTPRPVVLFTDSNYVIHGVSHRLQVWKRNGFITALGTPVINRELWEALDSILKRVELHCVKVDYADNDPYHRRCDELAGILMRRNRL